jgi:hypothetical protein
VINFKPMRSASNPPTSYQGLSDSQTYKGEERNAGQLALDPAIRILRILNRQRHLRDSQRMERVDHHRQLLGAGLADAALGRSGSALTRDSAALPRAFVDCPEAQCRRPAPHCAPPIVRLHVACSLASSCELEAFDPFHLLFAAVVTRSTTLVNENLKIRSSKMNKLSS